MGGAFLAVADDATSTHWNPAGLVAGGPAGMTIGWYRFQSGKSDGLPAPGAGRRSGTFTSLGTWPLGISYGNFEMSTVTTQEPLGAGIQTLRTRQAGVTILQTVVEGLVVGSTVRYVRGGVVTAVSGAQTVVDALRSTDAMEARTRGTIDLDIGVMADMDRLRVALAWKNVRSPTFGDVATGAMTLPRQARFGLAVLPSDGVTLAMDVDLDAVGLTGDLRRMFALGGEGRVGRHLAVRSGIRWSLTGARHLLGSAGMSVTLRRGLWLDGHYAQGHLDEEREFGVALRAGL